MHFFLSSNGGCQVLLVSGIVQAFMSNKVPMVLLKFLLVLVLCKHSSLFDVVIVSENFWCSASMHLLWLYSTETVLN